MFIALIILLLVALVNVYASLSIPFGLAYPRLFPDAGFMLRALSQIAYKWALVFGVLGFIYSVLCLIALRNMHESDEGTVKTPLVMLLVINLLILVLTMLSC